jgi:lipopolysaccharide/colanic/teichoic acid biosynthesis glycosyltransferase
MNKCRIEYSLIGNGLVIAKGEEARNTVVIQDKGNEGKYNFVSFNNNKWKVFSNENSLFKPFSSNVINHKVYLSVKRLLDILLSALGLVILLPVFIIIAISIKIGSRGPVFFHQRRCGKEGQEFKMYKFRTMVIDAEKLQKQLLEKNIVDGPMFKIEDDPRITGGGGFLRMTSLDELPQLFNVLRGEMTMVGPRPLKMEEMAFGPSWRDIRLSVKPGITGLWQVEARSSRLFHDWIRYDVAYVKNQSLWLDIKILFKTIKVVLKGSRGY